jgi:hypothetical protein
MKFLDFRKNVKVKFSLDKNRYVMAKVEKSPKFSKKILSIINDTEEITVIAIEGTELTSISEKRDFRRITFEITVPFNLTGFLAHVSTLLAHKNIPIFVISAFSTDHILVKDIDVDEAITLLQKDGMHRLDASR